MQHSAAQSLLLTLFAIEERDSHTTMWTARAHAHVWLPLKLKLFLTSKVLAQVGEQWRCRLPHVNIHHGLATAQVNAQQACQRVVQSSLAARFLRWRAGEQQRILGLLAENPYAGFIAALVTGMRDHIDHDQWQILRTTGTSHLMAISGLHIALLAWLVYRISYWLWSCNTRLCLSVAAVRIAAFCALLMAGAYSAMAGFNVATQRAFIMLSVVMGAKCLGLKHSPWDSFAYALIGVLMWDPLAVLSPGSVLSFSAVFFLFYSRSASALTVNAWFRCRQLAIISIALMPLGWFYFGGVAQYGLIANSFAIPWMSGVIVPLSLLGSAIKPLCLKLGGLLLHMAAWNLTGLMWLLSCISTWPHALWLSQLTHPVNVVVALILVTWLFAPRGFPARQWGWVFLLPIVWPSPHLPSKGNAWIDVLDVGQGLAVVVRTARHVLLYDLGDHPWHAPDSGMQVVLPFLRFHHIDRIDQFVLSHADRDHIGGFDSLGMLYPRTPVLAGDFDRIQAHWPDRKIKACIHGQQWRWEDVEFKVLAPFNTQGHGNDASCVLQVRVGQQTVWLTGDMTTHNEAQIMQHQQKPMSVLALVAPHHGSRTGSSAVFVKWLAPQVVVFSTGLGNRYHFPHPEVVARYRQQGSLMYNTAHDGAIHIQLTTRQIQPRIRCYRPQPLWWQPKANA